MPRTKPEKGKIYHIFNRGVEKRNIFISEGDRWRFLQGMYLFNNEDSTTNLLYRLEQRKGKMHFGILRDYMQREGVKRKPLVRIMADCLKHNHFHFSIEETQENGISRFMQKLGIGYTKYFNKKYERVGPLFQGKFKLVEIQSDAQLMYLIAYINAINPGQELEPELKSVAQDPEQILEFIQHYPWSTHLEYLGKRDSIIIDKGVAGELFGTPIAYRKFVEDIVKGKKSFGLSKKDFLE